MAEDKKYDCNDCRREAEDAIFDALVSVHKARSVANYAMGFFECKPKDKVAVAEMLNDFTDTGNLVAVLIDLLKQAENRLGNVRVFKAAADE